MNTRLQVEHPVTEAVIGVDLVELQLAVAEGRAARLRSGRAHGPRDRGAALRRGPVRSDWQPQSGLLTRFDVPAVDRVRHAGSYGVRLDSGFESGSEVSTHYDAMLAKVIAWAPTRREAARMLAGALRRARLHGIVTNRDLAGRRATRPDVRGGRGQHRLLRAQPAWSSREHGSSTRPTGSSSRPSRCAGGGRRLAPSGCRCGIPVALAQRRLAAAADQLAIGTTEHAVEWFGTRDGLRRSTAHRARRCPRRTTRASRSTGSSRRRAAQVAAGRGRRVRRSTAHAGRRSLRDVPRFVDPADAVASGSLLAPMPGSVVAVDVEDGADRGRGQHRAGARGDEDAAHDQRADRRGRHRPRRASVPRWPRATCSRS